MSKVQIVYKYGEKEYINSSEVCEVSIQETDDKLTVILNPKKEIQMVSSVVFFDDRLNPKEKFFSNGYQSWTDSKEQGYLEKTKKMGFLGRMKKLEDIYHFSAYGDYNFIQYHKHYSFSYTYIKGRDGKYRFYGSNDERNGYTVFYLNKRDLYAYKDNKGVKINKPIVLFSIVKAKGSEDEVFDKYASSFDRELVTKEKIKGFTTWYRHYQDIDENKVLTDLEAVKREKLGFQVFQIDDGYEKEIGDWVVPDKKKFPKGLGEIVESIHSQGMKAGIWVAPFVVSKESEVYKKHPDWILKDGSGSPMIHGSNWGGVYILDIQKEEVKDHLHKVFSSLKDVGFDLFKLDFLYAVSNKPTEKKSRAQIMIEAMEFLREELKGKIILSCGVPIFPAFFNSDYCRIGTDISLIYNDVFYMRFCHRERISSKLSIQNTYYRRQLNSRFFLNDPDVILLKGTKMKEKQKEKIYQIAKKYGSVFFTSDDLSLYESSDKKKWEELK